MAKRSRKKRKQQRQPNVPQYEVPVESASLVESASEDKEDAGSTAAVVAPVAAVPAASITGRSTIDAVDWKSEYPFVMADLRRLFIVSVLMLALLLVLNYFLV